MDAVGQAAFIAGRFAPGIEGEGLDAGVAMIDGGIDPAPAQVVAEAVDPQPGLEVVERADDGIGIAQAAGREGVTEVADDGGQPDGRVEPAGMLDEGFGLGAAEVGLAQQDRAGQVVDLDVVEIEDLDPADAEQAQILDDFIADGARADDEKAAALQRFLGEAGNGTVATVAIARRRGVGDQSVHRTGLTGSRSGAVLA